MADFYTHGLDAIGRDWASADIRVVLLLNDTFVDSSDFLDDVVAANTRCGVSGYSDFVCTGKVRTVNTGANQIEYDMDDPDFTSMSLGSGEVILAFVIYLRITNDAASVPILFESISGGIASEDVTTIVVDTIVDTLVQGP